ncbi:MAG: hypothetical protein A3F18_07805 [Legionellales bacterium RIFCSPHIGHO2_12_FULL_37_14]|nr:MAG: hypothetical protein A3F18_07805 [Legionellales bacterium RIFCSPHIGHO2_12_FULL_37_14]
MLKFKKTAVAVLALSSSAVFAGTMGPVCVPGNVTIPCERDAWDVGGQALYLQSTYTGSLWSGNILTSATTGDSVQNIDPKWGWGFEIEGSYHFNTGNDLNLNWYHLNRSTSRTLLSGSYAGSISVNPKWDQVDLELGQEIDFSDMKNVRIHGGIEWARVTNQLNLVSTSTIFTPFNTTAVTNLGVPISDSMTYNGFGPRFGIDMNYGLGNGFGIYGNAAASLLIGSLKQTVAGFTGADIPLNMVASKTTMVPELEGKLGARYDFMVAQGDLGLDVGYMWYNYFDAQTIAYGGDYSNFSLNGLFFGAKWVGNV